MQMTANDTLMAEIEEEFNFNSIQFNSISKSMQIVTAAMKLKDPCSLEENLWQT